MPELAKLVSVPFQMEEGEFKNWTEKMQARLMSSSVDTPQQLQSIFESLIAKKQSLCEVLQAWNSRYGFVGFLLLALPNLFYHSISEVIFCFWGPNQGNAFVRQCFVTELNPQS